MPQFGIRVFLLLGIVCLRHLLYPVVPLVHSRECFPICNLGMRVVTVVPQSLPISHISRPHQTDWPHWKPKNQLRGSHVNPQGHTSANYGQYSVSEMSECFSFWGTSFSQTIYCSFALDPAHSGLPRSISRSLPSTPPSENVSNPALQN